MSPNLRSLGTQALWSALCQSAAAMAVVKITAADPAARRLGSVVESYIPSPASHRCKSVPWPTNPTDCLQLCLIRQSADHSGQERVKDRAEESTDPVLGTVQFIIHSKHTKPLPTFQHKFCINYKHIRHLMKTQDPHDIIPPY